ncbi:MAG: HAD family hydrolase [Terriglobia bacterium]
MNTAQNGRLHEIGLLIFDLDGTLIDSEADLALSVNAMLEYMKREPLARPVIASYVGQGVAVLVRRALGPAASEAMVDDASSFFLDYYRDHMLDHTTLYPGVVEALERLKPRQMAVLTNKPVNFSSKIIAGLELDRYFAFVYGGNSFGQKKPDPVGILRLIEDTGIPPAQTLMIGDSETDIQTGRNAGTWTCGVSYGMGSHTLAQAQPDLLLDDLRELPLLLSEAHSAPS